MNWRRGLFRLWLALSILYVAGVFAVFSTDFGAELKHVRYEREFPGIAA